MKNVVVGVAALIVLGLVAFFVVSKPFQTQVKEQFRQGTEWTPENIQADPVGYLTWALGEADKTEQKLEASVIGLKTKKNAASRSLEKHTADATEYTKLLEEFKQAYTDANGTYPVNIRGVNLDETALKRKIVECNDKLQNVKELQSTYEKTKGVIDRKMGELEAKRTEVTKLKSKLGTQLEIAKVNKTVEGIEGIGDTLSSIIDTSDALVSTAEEGTDIEAFITPTGDARVDDEFDKIMGGSAAP